VYHHFLKNAKKVGILSVFFASKCVKNKCFWVFFEAKYAFFEAFLGVKTGKNPFFSVVMSLKLFEISCNSTV
jgi:hypothetical protein